jgi:2-phosphosulfolactate phosphatase
MRVENLFAPGEINEAAVKGKTVAVIDVLRACTTMAYAMARGCERIIPVGGIEAATTLAASLDKNVTLLAGEREGKPIDGFDLGNSPAEYKADVVKGKTIILATTNGTRAITMSQGADRILITSLVNMQAVVDAVVSLDAGDLTVVCAGDQDRFALEDAVCAGMLIDRLLDSVSAELSDGAYAARQLYKLKKKSIDELLRSCEHGKYLQDIGFGTDLDICAGVDKLSVIPTVKDGRIDRLKRGGRK